MSKVSDIVHAESVCAALLDRGAALVEVFAKEGSSVCSRVSAHGPRSAGIVHEAGIALRAWSAEGRSGFASQAVGLEDAGCEEAVESLSVALRESTASGARPELPGNGDIASGDGDAARAPAPWDNDAAIEAAAQLLYELTSGAARPGRAAIRLDAAWCEAGSSRLLLCNSRGLRRVHEQAGWELTLCVTAEKGGQARRGYLGRRAARPEELRPAELLEEVSWRTAACLGAEKAPAGRGPVLLDSVLASQMLQHLGPALVAGEESVAALRRGWTVGPRGLEIAELAPPPGEPSWDGEGVPRGAVKLVEEGRLTALLTDVESAARFSLPRTGSCHRLSFRDRPVAAPSHLRLEMKGADHSLESLLGQLAPGLYMTTARYFPDEDGAAGVLVGGGIWMDGGRVAGPARALVPLHPISALARLRAAGAPGGESIEGADCGVLLIADALG